jgi:hypothetical protein
MGNGQWAMGNGQWAKGNGQWAMGMVTMSAAPGEQLSNSSVFGGAELTMELVGPGTMKTGPVQRSKKGPDLIKKWLSGNQQSSVASNKCASQMRTGD